MSDPRGIISPPPVGGVRIEGAMPLRRVDKRRKSEDEASERRKKQPPRQRPNSDIPDDGQPHIDLIA